jgi:hypothetical protein
MKQVHFKEGNSKPKCPECGKVDIIGFNRYFYSLRK